jgi:hypothetical protein
VQLRAYLSAFPSGSVILEQWTPFTGNLEDSILLQENWAREGLRYLKALTPS